MSLFYKYLFWFTLLVCASNVYGQSIADSIQLEELVVTTRGFDREMRSTSPMQVMSGKSIKNIQALNVSDAVKHFSGVNIKDYGGIGGLKTISVRSLGSSHTAVNYNGIAVTDVQSGQIDIGRFSLDNVESISLTSGQSDHIFVTAREMASASALNILTIKPSFKDGEVINGKVSLKGGSFGLINPAFNTNIKLSNKLSANINGEWLSSNGEYPYELKYGSAKGDSTSMERRNNSDVQNLRLEGALYANISDKSKADIRLYYYNSERGLPGATIFYSTNIVSNQRVWDETIFTQGSFEHTFNNRWSAKINAKYNHGYLKYIDPDYQGNENGIVDIFNQNEIYGSASVLYKALNSVSFAASTDLSSATMYSNRKSFATPTRLLSQSSLAAKWINEYAIATASVVYTQTLESVKSGSASNNHGKLSPHISISAKPFIHQDLHIRAFYKNSFRLPTFNDLYYPMVGTRSLKPEDATQYNLGITYSTSINNIIPLLKFTADAYHNNVKNKIVSYPTSNLHQWAMMNFGKVEINGIDATIESAIIINKKANLLLSASYTYQNAVDKTDKDKSTYNNQIPYTPNHSGSARAALETKWVDFAYSLLWSGSRYSNASNSERYFMEGYYDHGVTIAKELDTKIGKLTLSVEGINLLNKNYQIVQNFPMPGRSYRANIILKF